MNQEQSKLEEALNNAQTQTEIVDAQISLSTHFRYENTEHSLELARAAEKLATQQSYYPGLVEAFKGQMNCHRILGQYQDALAVAEKAMIHFHMLEDRNLQARLLDTISPVYMELGDLAKGLEGLQKALMIYQDLDNVAGQARVLHLMGVLHSMTGDHTVAIEHFLRSAELFDALGNLRSRAALLNSCCVDYTKLGEYERAYKCGEQALQLFRQLEHVYGAIVAQCSLGEVALARQDFVSAIDHLEQALSSLQQFMPGKHANEILEAQLNLGRAYLGNGNQVRALELVQRVLASAESQGLQILHSACHQLLSQIYERMNDLPSALYHLRKYVEIHEVVVNETNNRNLQNLQILHNTQQAIAESEKQKRLREQERRAFERLNQIKEDFLHGATHDIKNPLTVISSLNSLLRRRIPADDEKSHQFIDRVGKQVNMIVRMVEGMLELAKWEIAPIIEMETVTVAQWFQGISDKMEGQASDKGIEFMVDVQPEDLNCTCDKARMETVVENLLSTTIRLTPHGRVVRLLAACLDNQMKIQVVSNEMSIPSESSPKDFKGFCQGDDNTYGDDPGIDLSLAKLSVEQHGGTIDMESNPGKGVTFTILLPN